MSLVAADSFRFLPYVGYVTIAMNDFPQLKYALLGSVGLFLLIQKDQS